MTDLRADSKTGEQFVFDERTADPASTEEGERWLRTDLDSGDKIATLRVDVGSSILDVPVFPVGTAEDSVVEAIRVRVGSQTGYIPAVPETNANFPALRLQHNGQVFGYHDEQGVFAFFDVAISSTNSPVKEGSDLNVDYSVVNTGFSLNNTQDIRLNIDSTEEDRDTNITLSPSSSTTGTLTWTTPSSSAGTYNASVLSDDDTASTSVTVEAGPAIPDSALTQDLVAWYRFEDGDARDYTNDLDATFADSTAYDGTVNGATFQSSGGVTDFENGANSGAFDFPNDSDNIDLGINPYGLANNDPISILGWANTSDTDAVLFNAGFQRLAIRASPTWEVKGFNGSSTNIVDSGVSPSGSYQHLAVAYDGSTVRIFVDGIQENSESDSNFYETPDGWDSYIGYYQGGGDSLTGQIDDVRIYNRALTSSEISDIFNATKP